MKTKTTTNQSSTKKQLDPTTTDRKTTQTPKGTDDIDKPIHYHDVVEMSLDFWARECDTDQQALREGTELSIRTRHHEAKIKHDSHKARDDQPNVYTLLMGSLEVLYTVEASEIVIYGYAWEPDPFYHLDGLDCECGDLNDPEL